MNTPPENDLHALRERIRSASASSSELMDESIRVAQSARCDKVWLQTCFESAREAAACSGVADLPLAGLAVSIKDLFDVQGQITRAGSVALAPVEPSAEDCPAVARLRAAGGAIIGRTNMVEFAFSGVGINPHFGTPANAASRDRLLIPGGSSSGAGVSVATGACHIALGSDTGGSIRIPAALNGTVGFKSTARLVPTAGAIPLSTTLDTVGALTRSVRDAILAHDILSAKPVTRSAAPLQAYRLAVAKRLMLDDLEQPVARAFDRALSRLSHAGARIEWVDLAEMAAVADLQGHGGFSAAESLAWHRPLLATRRAQYDPRVLTRIERGGNLSAADYVDLIRRRAEWIAAMERQMEGFDAILSPTVPILATPIALVAPGEERDDAFFGVNGRLLRNTSPINLLDGCAISIPCHDPDELPVGLMIWQGAMRDDTVLNVALQAEGALRAR